MTLNEFNNYLNAFLEKENFSDDPSLNGIQIQNSSPDSKQLKKVAFAVDACEATALAAANENADVLIVHHGLFWGGCETITGSFYKRIAPFIKNDLALIAYHIPLDANNPYGNNYGLANLIGLTELEPFAFWHGMPVGVKGKFSSPLSLDEVCKKVSEHTKTECQSFPFGKKDIRNVGIVSGGASGDVWQAVEDGLDLYITGVFMHDNFHYAKEMKMNVISGGHYGTEIIGVTLLKEKIEKELGLQTLFIDQPTAL